MRKSALKTRLAKARVAAGIRQEDLAKMSLISAEQIRHFESGGRPLTGSVAARLGNMLGVSGAWILGFGSSNEPIGIDGNPYTKETYKRTRWDESQTQDAELKALDCARADAWARYLVGKIESMFQEARGQNAAEYAGCEIDIALEKLRQSLRIDAPKLQFNSVDEAMAKAPVTPPLPSAAIPGRRGYKVRSSSPNRARSVLARQPGGSQRL
jgi:transcriptional regulator with XRE-family HTH domain